MTQAWERKLRAFEEEGENVGFGIHSGPSRGDVCRPGPRPSAPLTVEYQAFDYAPLPYQFNV